MEHQDSEKQTALTPQAFREFQKTAIINQRRAALGFLVSPLAAIILMMAVSLGSGIASLGSAEPGDSIWEDGAGLFLLFAIPLIYLLAAVIGLPSLMVLRRKRWFRGYHFALTGLVIGILLGITLGLCTRNDGDPYLSSIAARTAFTVAFSVVAYVTYWQIAIRPHGIPGFGT